MFSISYIETVYIVVTVRLLIFISDYFSSDPPLPLGIPAICWSPRRIQFFAAIYFVDNEKMLPGDGGDPPPSLLQLSSDLEQSKIDWFEVFLALSTSLFEYY
jgi:hypothetical protein